MRMIQAGIAGGATLTVVAVVPGKRIFKATMTWPGEPSISGPITMNVMDAIEQLDAKLEEHHGAAYQKGLMAGAEQIVTPPLSEEEKSQGDECPGCGASDNTPHKQGCREIGT